MLLLGVTVERGLRPGLGVQLIGGLRQVNTRIHFLTPERQPLTFPEGSIHHRDETLTNSADASVLIHAAMSAGAWSISSRGGLSLPFGSTVENPFALVRQGLAHQHVQFGTGTFDPLLGLAAGRRLGQWTITTNVDTRIVIHTTSKGYRAGDRFHCNATLTTPRRGGWSGTIGADVLRENSETWNGTREAEGNLGRTDALVSFGVVRPLGSGALTLSAQVPFLTRAVGAQIHHPVIVSLGWSQ